VYLVDGSLYVFRAWQSGPLQLDDNERPCNAVRGFAAWLSALLDSAATRPLACFFDAHDGVSQRRGLHPPYKADRPPVDPLLLSQIRDCEQLCRLLGLPTLRATTGGTQGAGHRWTDRASRSALGCAPNRSPIGWHSQEMPQTTSQAYRALARQPLHACSNAGSRLALCTLGRGP